MMKTSCKSESDDESDSCLPPMQKKKSPKKNNNNSHNHPKKKKKMHYHRYYYIRWILIFMICFVVILQMIINNMNVTSSSSSSVVVDKQSLTSSLSSLSSSTIPLPPITTTTTTTKFSNQHQHQHQHQQHQHQHRDSLSPPSSSSSSSLSSLSSKSNYYVQIEPNDTIYYKGRKKKDIKWDTSPIVIEKYKLIFFTIPKVGCTVFKQLFRRMMGYKNWKTNVENLHNPRTNGLTYLWDYSINKATQLINDPSWTKAIFIREPKLRLLSAYLDKVVIKNGLRLAIICCPPSPTSPKKRSKLDHQDDINIRWCLPNNGGYNWTFEYFVHWTQDLTGSKNKYCYENEHWSSQYSRFEMKYWPIINFIGHLETAANDTKRLLERIGAWEKYGKSGWGSKSNNNQEDNDNDGSSGSSSTTGSSSSIFESKSTIPHATSSINKIQEYYDDNPNLEKLVVEKIYYDDYNFKLFNFTYSS